ncbi:MAG: hypothetical protein Kilf2KO_45410 [Rhodospirillales bacterium]
MRAIGLGLLSLFLWAGLPGGAAMASDAEVVAVKITPQGQDHYQFDVTVRHPDTGWDAYADRWEVLAPDGSVLGTRVLAHPHVDEQPFTRSLGGVAIPAEIEEVTVRARDSVDGWGSVTMTLPVPR